ncbi:hypothetical protein [Haloferax sp. ATB1]|uniref:hypothetical protein n=1 Tax=Haloferax sp. ATB1 TaxID=1508454 RepID=UPI000ADCAD3A|nr:hypothetical protein [Haloferax sp. ATB1]
MAETEELIDYLESRAGDSLRAVGKYSGETCSLEYVRDDLAHEKVRDRLEAIQANITWSWNPPEDSVLEELGPKSASLQVREAAVILHLPAEDREGVIIGLEPGAASDLTSFITDCMRYVGDTSGVD